MVRIEDKRKLTEKRHGSNDQERVDVLFLSIPANTLPDVMPTVSRYERQKRRLLGLHVNISHTSTDA